MSESEERFAMLATTTFDAILIQDKGVVLDWNLSSAEMFGYACSEVLGPTGRSW
jgi:PAS domain S-box-containing protein